MINTGVLLDEKFDRDETGPADKHGIIVLGNECFGRSAVREEDYLPHHLECRIDPDGDPDGELHPREVHEAFYP